MTKPTERLDAGLQPPLAFEASVVAVGTHGDRPAVALDRTGFYPEGGGQRGDRGWLGAVEVVDTQLSDGVVWHVLAEDVSLSGAVAGRVDRGFRANQARLHTAQHLASRLLHDRFDAPTESARMSPDSFTIDLSRADLTAEHLASVEDELLAWVLADHPVEVRRPTPTELAALPIRSAPKVTEDIRVVVVGEAVLDATPCGGCHVSRTGELGVVRLAHFERYKGGTRVRFRVGPGALHDDRQRTAAMTEAATLLKAPPLELATAVARVLDDRAATRERLARLQQELIKLQGAALGATAVGEDPRSVVARLPDDDAGFARALAAEIARAIGGVAVVACPGKAGLFVAATARESVADLGAWLRPRLQPLGFRGGGRGETLQGSMPEDRWAEVAAALLR